MNIFQTALFALIFILTTVTAFAQQHAQGWVPTPRETERFVRSLPAVYGNQVQTLVARDENADALLYRALIPCLEEHGLAHWIKRRGDLKVVRAYNQNPVGSCVGNATAAAISVLNANEIWYDKEPQTFMAMHSADGVYGLCREAAGMLGNRGDGCSGSGAARAITQFGTLYQLKYENADLTYNSPARQREFGYRGVGEALKNEAAKHKVRAVTRVRTAGEAWSLIGNGYPINVCSNQGFASRRDAEGVCKPSGSWNHSMAVIARRTVGDGRKLFLIWNSWGDDWCAGPYWEDMPEGSFWIEWNVMNTMLSRGDSFAYSQLDGFPPRTLPDYGGKFFLGKIIIETESEVHHATSDGPRDRGARPRGDGRGGAEAVARAGPGDPVRSRGTGPTGGATKTIAGGFRAGETGATGISGPGISGLQAP